MADTFTWTYDNLDGVYKNHYISKKILELAAQNFKFVPFTTKHDGFGKNKGETVNIPHWKNLDVPADARLDELTRIPIDTMEQGTRAITVEEWGRGVRYTRLDEELSTLDPKSAIQKKLRLQMEHVLDNAAAAAFKQAKICYIPTSATGGTWDVDGTPSTEATNNITGDHIALIRDYLTNDLHAPPYDGGHYIGIFSTKGLRGLKSDNSLSEWWKYLRKGDVIYKSEVGELEQVRFIENTNEDALSNGIGSGSVLGEGLVFGDEAVTRVEVEAPHLRADPNFQSDFGRIKAVIWYGILAFGITWDSANDLEAKVIRVTSS